LVEKPCGAALSAGDVVVFRMRAGMVAKHLGIVSQAGPEARFIHAYTGHGVVENALSDPWARRIVGRFEFPKGA
jgi:NlpC/P60 family putative phage cell wall peptidase